MTSSNNTRRFLAKQIEQMSSGQVVMELLLSRGLNFERKVMGLHARKMCIAYTPKFACAINCPCTSEKTLEEHCFNILKYFPALS